MKITPKTKIEDVLPLIGALDPCDPARRWLAGLAEYTLAQLWSTPDLWWCERFQEEAWSWANWLLEELTEDWFDRFDDTTSNARETMRRLLKAHPLRDVIPALQALEDS